MSVHHFGGDFPQLCKTEVRMRVTCCDMDGTVIAAIGNRDWNNDQLRLRVWKIVENECRMLCLKKVSSGSFVKVADCFVVVSGYNEIKVFQAGLDKQALGHGGTARRHQ